MEIREGNCLLEIVHLESSPPGTPTAGDLRYSVCVSSDGFAGSSPHVWADADGFGQFLNQLKELEASRRGVARMDALGSPDAFWLEIRSIDGAGHMAVFGRIQRCEYLNVGQSLNQSVEFGFEFCPSRLQSLLAEFTLMVSNNP